MKAEDLETGVLHNNKHYVAVCWLGGSEPTHKPSDKAIKSVKWLHEQVGGELRPHSSFKQTACPGDAWRQHIVEGLATSTVSNESPPDMVHPSSIQKKLDTIIAKLENIENKLKLGNLIR
jgi:hypothetical protein